MTEQIEKWLSRVGRGPAGSIGSIGRASARSGVPRANSIGLISTCQLGQACAGAHNGQLAPLARSIRGLG
jgi:hypothetical protein